MGVLVYRYIGVPVYLCTVAWVHRCTNVPVYQCAGVPVYLCIGATVKQCARVPVCQCTGVPLYRCIGRMHGCVHVEKLSLFLSLSLSLPLRLVLCSAATYRQGHTWSPSKTHSFALAFVRARRPNGPGSYTFLFVFSSTFSFAMSGPQHVLAHNFWCKLHMILSLRLSLSLSLSLFLSLSLSLSISLYLSLSLSLSLSAQRPILASETYGVNQRRPRSYPNGHGHYETLDRVARESGPGTKTNMFFCLPEHLFFCNFWTTTCWLKSASNTASTWLQTTSKFAQDGCGSP